MSSSVFELNLKKFENWKKISLGLENYDTDIFGTEFYKIHRTFQNKVWNFQEFLLKF